MGLVNVVLLLLLRWFRIRVGKVSGMVVISEEAFFTDSSYFNSLLLVAS